MIAVLVYALRKLGTFMHHSAQAAAQGVHISGEQKASLYVSSQK